jgi:hypothetical protein
MRLRRDFNQKGVFSTAAKANGVSNRAALTDNKSRRRAGAALLAAPILGCAASLHGQVIFQDQIVSGYSYETGGPWTLTDNVAADASWSDSSTKYASPPSGLTTSGLLTTKATASNTTSYINPTSGFFGSVTPTSGYSTVFMDISIALDNAPGTANIATMSPNENSSILASLYAYAQTSTTYQLEVLTSTDASGSHSVTTATGVTGLPLNTWETFRFGETITSADADTNGHADVAWSLYTQSSPGVFNTTPIATGTGFSFSTFTAGTAQYMNEIRIVSAGAGATEDLGVDNVTAYSSNPTVVPEPASAGVCVLTASSVLFHRPRRKRRLV